MKNLKEVYGFGKKPAKKLSAKELRKIILEEVSLLKEDADPSKVDPERFPLTLSQAAAKADQADALVTKGVDDGSKDDDTVSASEGELAVKSLKPSQSSMNIEKACQFAICALLKVEPFQGGPGGDLGAIITSDNHIMDGHHRWIATGMVDPGASVGGFVVEFPAKQMIAALNMITVKLGITSGKAGSGGFGQFNEAGILKQLQKLVKEGFWGADAEKCQSALEEWTGQSGDAAVSAAAKKMGDNVSQLTLSVPGGFPERPDMPVISKKKGHLKQAIDLLRSGAVDLNEPYAAEGEKTEESRRSTDDLVLERWKRLAGIL